MSDVSLSPAPEMGKAKSPPAGRARASVELFLISFFILFFELACIRWFASTVIFLTFFTNIVLLACFLGVSVGCLAAGRRWSWMNAMVPLSILATASAYGVFWGYRQFGELVIDFGSQQSPQLIYFGTDTRLKDPTKWIVPIELVAGYFFALIALVFVGPGQELGRRLARIENRVLAYTADILGSLSGIVAFGVMSYFRVSAPAWFLVALAIGVYFVPRRRILHAAGAIGVIGLTVAADWPTDDVGLPLEIFWSPYYQVRYCPRYLSIDVNNIGHQGMVRVDRTGSGYTLPHLLGRSALGRPFDNVLVIGAGSGNDVAAALALGAGHVDAVEIDPVLNQLGKFHHPNRPYQDPRVTVHLDDGRSFLRTTNSRYDLIIYALVDSLALHPSYSSVRLESFLFTEQAFRDVKARLKPGGMFVMYNFYRQGWVVSRLAKLAELVFDSRPIVISSPHQDTIHLTDNLRGKLTFILVGNGASRVLESIRSNFAAEGSFWINPELRFNLEAAGFGRKPRASRTAGAPHFRRLAPVDVELDHRDPIPTDDWPFLYLRGPAIPDLNLRGMTIVAALALSILVAFAPVRRVRPSGQMFFLGAAFMLLETKGVVHMALLFGSTWMVNSIVFFAILAMILLSNLYVMAFHPRRIWPFYALLFAALAFDSSVSMDQFLSLPGSSKVIVSCAVVYIPVLFAGVIFATAFRSSRQPDADFGSNIAGVIVGGLSEYLSLIIGFNHLLLIAIGFYALSAFCYARNLVPAAAATANPTS